MIRATDLLGARVETEDGRRLGHVHDLRVRREHGAPDGGEWRLVALVVGWRGWLERFGVTGAKRAEPILAGDAIPWTDVQSVEAGVVVVRGSGAS